MKKNQLMSSYGIVKTSKPRMTLYKNQTLSIPQTNLWALLLEDKNPFKLS